MNDESLLMAFRDEGTEDAFAELVRRPEGVVYGTALRLVKNPDTAEEIAQQVFCTLAQKAHTVRNPALTIAWLHRTSHQLALLHLRTEKRRQLREHAAVMDLTSPDSAPHWQELEPLLDGALETLDEPDRTAILLRYFEGRSMVDVGSALGVGEGAARMRVDRKSVV